LPGRETERHGTRHQQQQQVWSVSKVLESHGDCIGQATARRDDNVGMNFRQPLVAMTWASLGRDARVCPITIRTSLA
jgi:hypothetical protein